MYIALQAELAMARTNLVRSGTCTDLYEDRPHQSFPCQVRLSDESLLISFDDPESGQPIILCGSMNVDKTWELKRDDGQTVATLTQGNDPDFFEGTFTESGWCWKWEVMLDDTDDTEEAGSDKKSSFL